MLKENGHNPERNVQLVSGAHGNVKNDKIVDSNVLVKSWSVLDYDCSCAVISIIVVVPG